MIALKWAAAIVCGYLIGSVNIAIIITKFILHNDVRTHGSGNAGAANVARVFGPALGVGTLLGDMAKTALAMLLGLSILGTNGMCAAAAACMIGHCFPAFFGFRGGKGVGVAAGAAFMLDWRLALVLLGVYVIAVLSSRRASVGSLVAVLLYPVAMLIMGGFAAAEIALGFFITVAVWFMHRANIKRIIKGEESQFSFGKKK